MFRRPFKGFAGPVEHSVPTSQTMVPYCLLEILKAVCSCLTQVFEVGEISGSPGGCQCFPRLILEHLELWARGFPPMVEITKETAVLTINGARKPNMHEAMQLHAKLVAQTLLHEWRV